MQRIFNSRNFPKDIKNAAVTLGNFDGVHLGHLELIRHARNYAKGDGGSCIVYTFDPHPVKVLAPQHCPPLLQTLEQKLASLEEAGVDICAVEPFTEELAHMEAEAFFRNILVERLSAKAIVVGHDFTFGLHRKGTYKILEEFGKEHDISVERVEAQFIGDTLISSTNIRETLARGEVKTAESLLGRPYSIEGRIISGRGVGETLDAHTANIETQNEVIPKDGVYITRTTIRNGSEPPITYPSVTSLGDNPTFPIACYAIETHLLDVELDIMGWNVRVEFLKRTRDQIAFPSKDDLRKQIHRDVEEAREYHKSE